MHAQRLWTCTKLRVLTRKKRRRGLELKLTATIKASKPSAAFERDAHLNLNVGMGEKPEMQKMISAQVVIPVDGQRAMSAYLSYPQTQGSYPAVIVGMELFGVTQYIRNVTDRIAALGYLAIAPDFYHRLEPDVELTYDQAGRTKGFELLHQVSRSDALQDVMATMHFLRHRADCSGRIGFLGLSVGGHIGYLVATQLDLAACAIFYAGWLTNTDIELSQPEPTLTLTPGIARQGGQVLYFVGEKDALVLPAQREEIASSLAASKVAHEIVIYPEAQHGFFCEERDTYDPAASADAWNRTLKLFASALGS